MCPPKVKVPEPAPIPDPAPPIEQTATDFTRDQGTKKTATASNTRTSRKSASDLRVDLNVPGGGVGLQV